MPKLFKPWLDRIRAEIERLERSVTDVELSSIELPTKKEARIDKNKLNRAKSSLTRQKRRLTGKTQKLERRIARASKQHQSSSESILEWESQLQQLHSDAELQNVSGRQRSLERKIKALERRIAKTRQRQEKRSQAIAKWKTKLTSHQTAIKQDIETQLAQTSEKLKQLNRIEELRPIKNDWNVLTSLEKALKTDEQFIFVGQRSVQNPSVMQLIEKGFFTPDPEVEEEKKFLPHRHAFNLAFMKLMAQHGFEQCINWSPGSTDPMHFELFEGVDSLLSAPKLGK